MTNKLLSNLKHAHSLLMAISIVFSIFLFPASASAQVTPHSSDFNHMKTGFPLTGVHTNIECETCHVGGIFKGTPTDCAGCHTAGRRVVAPPKPVNHIVTHAACESCHNSTVSFLGARFNHIGVQPSTCMNCHNGSTAPGKPSGHVLTIASCDTCHRSGSWLPAGFNHAGAGLTIGGGRCSTCHGVTSLGKPSFHQATSAECDTCHTNFITFIGAAFNHAGVVPGTCGTCHGGASLAAKKRNAGHIPYTGNDCDSCHIAAKSYAIGSFANPVMNHTLPLVAATSCTTCHSGAYISEGVQYGGAKGKTSISNHIPVSTECNICHTAFTSFTTPLANSTTMHTSGIAPTACKTCHTSSAYKGVTGKKMSVTHRSSTATDCAQSGCHAPGGGTGTAYTAWTN